MSCSHRARCGNSCSVLLEVCVLSTFVLEWGGKGVLNGISGSRVRRGTKSQRVLRDFGNTVID